MDASGAFTAPVCRFFTAIASFGPFRSSRALPSITGMPADAPRGSRATRQRQRALSSESATHQRWYTSAVSADGRDTRYDSIRESGAPHAIERLYFKCSTQRTVTGPRKSLSARAKNLM